MLTICMLSFPYHKDDFFSNLILNKKFKGQKDSNIARYSHLL